MIAACGEPAAESQSVASDPAALAAASTAERMAMLGTTAAGLSEVEASRRLAVYGPNEPVRSERSHPLRRFVANFTNTLALLLWFAAGLSFATGVPELGGAIVVVVIVNGLFASMQERRAEQVVEALMRRVAVQANVTRNGAERVLPAFDLVPGDRIRLTAGDIVAADCVLVEADNLAVDLSMITGETLPVERSPQRSTARSGETLTLACIVPAGAGVATGSGVALVWATGAASTVAGVAALVAGVHRGASMLERQVASLARVTVGIAVFAGAATLVLATLRAQMDFLIVLTFATGVIVALVPEGLLPSLSVSLAIGARRMAERGAAVRRLSAVEIVGSVTVICTDKTGTLTLNRLTVEGMVPAADDAATREQALLAAGLCNDARPSDGGIAGDPLDVALADWLSAQGCDLEEQRASCPRSSDVPFDANRRYMAVTCLVDGRETSYLKGAPEAVLALTGDCALPESIEAALAAATARAERVLLLAGGRTHSSMRVLGLVRFYDPPRPELPAAIAACHQAGVRVAMLTGDHPATARAVAASIGFGPGDVEVVTGSEIDALSGEALLTKLQRDVVFARATPAQKLRLVTLLRAAGEVVVVTGDGINDAPALRAADVGVAMGLRGTEVAKQAADIVLADDNFATIVAAIEEGRAIKANIRRFVSYVFVSNVAELVPFLAYLILRVPLALTIMQALGISIGTDLLPALALGTESPSPATMLQPPEPPSRPLLTWQIGLRTFLLFGPLEAMLGFAAFLAFYGAHGWRPWHSLAPLAGISNEAAALTFLGIVGGQVGCLIAQRDGRLADRMRLLRNPWIARGLLFELTLTMMLVFVPGLNGLFSMRSVPPGWLLVVPVGAALFIVLDAVRRQVLARAARAHHRAG